MIAARRVPRVSLLLATTLALVRVGMPISPLPADHEVTVTEGDTLSGIALRYYGDAEYAERIAAYNHLMDMNALTVGQVLELPDLPSQGSAEDEAATVVPEVSAAVAAGSATAAASAPRAGPVIQTGLATWYGPGFEGQFTKCGEVFHESDLTASSNDLPCGTVIQVTDVASGASVVVTVDDTGAFMHPTILDLSKAAFSALASPEAGVLEVSVAPVFARPPAPIRPSA